MMLKGEFVQADFARHLERELADSENVANTLATANGRLIAEKLDLRLALAAKDPQSDEVYKASVELVAMLECKLGRERALADRLADHLGTALGAFDNQEAPHAVRANRTLAAWKEARSGTV